MKWIDPLLIFLTVLLELVCIAGVFSYGHLNVSTETVFICIFVAFLVVFFFGYKYVFLERGLKKVFFVFYLFPTLISVSYFISILY